jgi:RHS repeat-associated protein
MTLNSRRLSLETSDSSGNGTELSYIQQSPTPTPTPTTVDSAGDRYTGLDGFGRVVYQNWFNTLTGAQVEGDQYGYDNDSDVLYDNVVGQGSTAAKYSQLYHASSTASGDDNSGYDPLGRETTFIQGTLSASGNNTSSDASLDTVTNANINTAAGSDQTFTLDALGNRTSSDTGAGTGTSTAPTLAATTATYNSQNETSETFNSCCYCFFPTYDNDGNMTADGTGDTYTYDAWGDMMSGSDSSSCGCACTTTTAGFDYDANGRQIEQNDATSTNCSCGCSCGVDTYAFRDADEYYSDQAQVVEDDGSYASCCCTYNYSCGCNFSASCTYGCATDNYSWGLDYVNDLVLRDSSGTVGTWTDVNGTITSPTPTSLTPQRIYAEHDANFDIKTLTNTSGTVLEHIVYDPYGNATLLNSSYGGGAGVFGSDSYHWIYGFQGGRYDPGSGLYHFGARNYSSATGRWMEQDPAGYVNGANTYQLEEDNPDSHVDPSGTTIGAKITAIVAYRFSRLAFAQWGAAENWLEAALGFVVDLSDNDNEMSAGLSNQMFKYYAWVASQHYKGIDSDWQTYTIVDKSAQLAVGQFEFASTGLFSTGWWLHGARNVKAAGTVELKCVNGGVYMRNVDMEWEWDDVIAANQWWEQQQNWRIRWGIPKFIEGLYGISADKIGHVYFPVTIKWKDKTYPNGIFVGRLAPRSP